MKFAVKTTDLENAVKVVMQAVPSKNPMPILSGIYMEMASNKLWLTSTDLDLSIGVYVPVLVSTGGVEGRTVLPAKALAGILKHASGATTEFEGVGDINTVKVRNGSAEWELNAMNPTEFPELPLVSDTKPFTVPGEMLVPLIKQTIFAVDKSGTRPFISGVLFDAQEYLVLTATDTFRLAVSRSGIACGFEKSVIVPVGALKALMGVIGDDEPEVTISINDKLIAFDVEGDITIISRIIPGTFPDYRRIIPTTSGTAFEADRQELIEAIERVTAIDRGDKYARMNLAFNVGDSRLTLASTADTGRANDVVQCMIINNAGDWQAAVNVSYVLEGLKAMSGDSVKVTYAGQSLMFEGGPNYLYLVALMEA